MLGYVHGYMLLSFVGEENALISSHPVAINGNGDFLQTLKTQDLISCPKEFCEKDRTGLLLLLSTWFSYGSQKLPA